MRFPVGKSGNILDPLWYDSQGFGAVTNYGYHEAMDLNLRTGGDSDIGQPLYAVSKGKIVYYHNNSHSTTGFGRHMVLECDTVRGKRWYHYAHCLEITAELKDVNEGDVIGKLGKSGTTLAHLHFSVFKVDPAILPQGIDTIAKTLTQLNDWWEKFEIIGVTMPEETISVLKTDFEKLVTKSTAYDKFVDAGYKSIDDLLVVTSQLNTNIDNLEKEKAELAVKLLECENQSSQPPLEDGIKWKLNGKTEETIVNGVKIIKNYAVDELK